VLRKKLTVLLTVALIALVLMVASATPGMAAARQYCVYYRGWHFISAKQFHKGNYKAYPARNCRGNAPGFAYSASASAPSYFGSTASASASASATATASATASPSALASTGGPALALPATLVATVGLVGFGIVALRTVLRRGGASS
jgi:hypothetical protein